MNKIAYNDVLDGQGPSCGFEGPHRAVWVNRRTDCAFLLDLMPDKYRRLHAPVQFSLAELDSLVERREIVPTRYLLPAHLRLKAATCEHQGLSARELRRLALTSKEVKTKDLRIEVVRPILMAPEVLEQLLEQYELGRFVAEASKKFNTPRWRVYQLVYRLLAYETIEDAMATDWRRSGLPNPEKPRVVTQKLGRPKNVVVTGHAPEKAGVNVSEEHKLDIWQGYTLFKAVGKSLAKIYRETRDRFWRIALEPSPYGPPTPILPPPETYPTLQQFKYWIGRKFDLVKRLLDKTPRRRIAKDHRGLHSTTQADAPWPGHTYQIDSTVVDIYLVSSFNRFWLIGRPILYFVVDTASGCIVGWHVALEGPNWTGARLALFNALSDKADLLRYYGFDLKPDEIFIPKAPTPRFVRPDRAEMLSHNGVAAAAHGLFDLQFPGSYRADLKPDIERLFRTINDAVLRWLPGAVKARLKERGERDYRLDAKLTLYEFTQITLAFMCEYNAHAEKGARLRDDAIRADVPPNPFPLFQWGLENLHGSPRYHSAETLYNHLLPTGRAVVTSRGVKFGGVYYRPSWGGEFPWATHARNFGRWSLSVSFNPNRPEAIHWLNVDSGEYETLIASPDTDFGEHARFEDVIDKEAYLDMEKQGRSGAVAQSESKLTAYAQAIVAGAEAAQQRFVPPSSATAHTSGQSEHRAREAAAQTALDPDLARALPPDAPVPPSKDEAVESIYRSDDMLDFLVNQTAEEV